MRGQSVNIEAIRQAAERIKSFVVETPLLRSSELDQKTGGRIYLKAENLQRSGSFKFRGAISRISALDTQERARGVVAYSSGNHALAVSEACRLVGIQATVIMPSDAPSIKIEGCRARGAVVHLYDRLRDDRAAIGAELVARHGMTMVAPYDDDHVMAGAGSGALEACAQMGQEPVDLALVCCSGGGMAAGWSVALRALHPEARVVVVEPAGFDDTARSLVAGRRLENERKSGSICDALLAVTPGERTFPILRDNGATGVSVTDEECLAAMHFAFANLKLVLEPGGASALAAALAGKLEMKGRNMLVACSGGNVDPIVFSRCLSTIPHAQAEE